MNNLYKKNIENIINYLLTFDVENIKFIWIKRIKKNNTIKKITYEHKNDRWYTRRI